MRQYSEPCPFLIVSNCVSNNNSKTIKECALKNVPNWYSKTTDPNSSQILVVLTMKYDIYIYIYKNLRGEMLIICFAINHVHDIHITKYLNQLLRFKTGI